MCFDNAYYKRVLELQDSELLWLPTDQAMFESPDFREYFIKYASDQNEFFKNYEVAHIKMSELGCKFEPESGFYIN